nr:hypothetical protein [Tanacetum cinerariifolium]
MEAGTSATILTVKLPILNPGEYDLWLMRIEQYFLMTDYSLWEVIKNGNKVLTKTVGIVEQPYEPTTVEEKLDRKNEMKARGTLLMAFLNKEQLKFHSYQDSKLLMVAIEKRYGGNKESKKVQRTFLKQQYENFIASSSETLDQTFDRLQKLISQLEIQGEVIKQEHINLKIIKHKSKSTKCGFLSSNSTNNTSSINEADNTAYGVSIAHTQEQIDPGNLEEMDLHWEMAMLTIRARRFIKRRGRNFDINGQKIDFDRSKVECFNCHKNGHFARECKASKNQENRGRDYQAKEEHPINFALMALTSSGSSSNSDSEVASYSKTCLKAYATLKEQYDSLSSDYKKSQFNLLSYKAGLQSLEERLVKYKKNEDVFTEKINILNLALDVYRKNLEKAKKERDELKLTLEKYQNSSKSLNTLQENQENVRSRSDKGYHAVPPSYTGNYIPSKPNLMFIDEQVESESMDVVSTVSSRAVKTVESKVKATHRRRSTRKKELLIVVALGTRQETNAILLIMKIMMVDLFPLEMEEAVNTAFYVLNMALVIKPHNKTPYELIRTRPPLIDFMKPFRCLVTILNTKDYLGKFDEKLMRDFFVGYFVVSKAVRVFNKRTRIVEETLNISFLENAPNVKGNGPDWLFDIDSLTISMNYVPDVTGFQTNGIVGTKDNIIADNSGQDDQVLRSEFEGLLQQERQTEHINSTNSFNTVSSHVNTAGPSFVNVASPSPINTARTLASTNAFEEHPFERFSPFKSVFSLPYVPITTLINDTGIFSNAYDDEAVEEEVNMNNVVSSYTIPDDPFTKFVKDHPKDQDELPQFKLLNVWTLVDLPKDKWAVGTKWVFRNKKDERGIVIKNKSRLVAQGHTQEEVYQMDVKSAFLYEKAEDELYVYQPPGFEDPNFPDKVYKVEKALYGLHQAPRTCYETLLTYLIDNGFYGGQIDKTLFIKRYKDDIQLMNFAPIAVLTKSGIVPISTGRQSSSRAAAPVSAVRPINTAASKPLGALQDALKDQGYFDSGCSMHMTGNISYITDFKEHDRG